MIETPESFEKRKKQHIEFALSDRAQTIRSAGFEQIQLAHEALPNINREEVNLETETLGLKFRSPVFVSSMTAGHAESVWINERIAKACARQGIFMGVGSQRRQLFDEKAQREWSELRQRCPDTVLLGNLGLSQLIETPVEQVTQLCRSISAQAMIIHTNPLQEVLQREGTPQFKGSFEALKSLVSELEIPVILKETGCGFSQLTLSKLNGLGLYAVDVSGFGGTHWGLVEGLREDPHSELAKASQVFADWGISTVQSLLNAQAVASDYKVWSSGGVRSGLDVAKSIALGAECVGIAGPVMKMALKSSEDVERYIEQVKLELTMALFCCGVSSAKELRERQLWQRQTETI